MQIETGTIIIIIAVLIFYLRLTIIQRERAKRYRRQRAEGREQQGKNKTRAAIENYSIVSRKRRNWIIAGAGAAAILLGVVLYLDLIPLGQAQEYAWLPVALGIVAFSWGFE